MAKEEILCSLSAYTYTWKLLFLQEQRRLEYELAQALKIPREDMELRDFKVSKHSKQWTLRYASFGAFLYI